MYNFSNWIKRMKQILLAALFLIALGSTGTGADLSYATLTPNQTVAQFRCEAVYTNADHQKIGARFRHIPSGFALDLVSIQSLPQVFIWVNSLPPSDQGEPHTCEHLLLGKGTVGRYVASLEDMSLTSSSAFTMQLQTCYHSHTDAGADVFFKVLKEQLNALVNPNFSDEEIRREVCNMGIRVDQADSSLQLEEKGTVYNEMISSFESPWGPMYFEIDRLVYGLNHPMSYSSGGFPDAIRSMTPQDLRTFHKNSYRINNMGAVLSIPPDITISDCLSHVSSILSQVDPSAAVAADPVTLNDRLPAPKPARAGTILIAPYPSQKADEPGQLVFAWPAVQKLTPEEQYLMELLMAGFSSDQTSILYKSMIDSKTRKIETGITSIGGWVSSDLGQPAYLAMENVNRDLLNDQKIDSLRNFVLSELRSIASFPDGSAELKKFNDDIKSRIEERKRNLRVFLNTPPRFGFRGTGSEWLSRVVRSARHSDFERSLVFESEFKLADSLLASSGNFWKQYLAKWGLLEATPFAVAAVADPTMLTQSEQARKERVAAYVANLKTRYAVASDTEAIAKFKSDYDKQTALIDQEAKSIPMPPFTDSPPLTLDDHLKYTTGKLPGGGELVASTFENMTGGTAGLAFRLDALPESLLMYVPAIPTLVSDVGIYKDGKAITSAEVQDAQRKEIQSLSVGYSVNYRTQRAEIVARASGSDSAETARAIGWLETTITNPDLREENLPRLRDAIDQAYANRRNRMRGSVEGWIDSPVNAYWRQDNPALMYADCFLTQTHALLRLKWMLRDGATPADNKEFSEFLKELAIHAKGMNKQQLTEMFESLTLAIGSDMPSTSADPLVMRASMLSNDTKGSLKEALADLRMTIAEIPEATLSSDLAYLCNEIGNDFAMPASVALGNVKAAMRILFRQDNARAFLIGSSRAQAMIKPGLERIVKRLDATPTHRVAHSNTPVVFSRLQEREPNVTRPEYAGLVFDDTRAGVFYNTATCASFVDSTDEALYNFLAARLYGGGGAHSMFMKTWGAGLAYSNGLRSNEMSGRIVYYAERCPELSQTMQFVVNELKNAPNDPSLAEYALAQAFAMSRAGSGYEARGEAMAADLADGLTPDVVTRFRKKMLALRQSDMFAQQVQARMETVYGLLLPGYGPSAQEAVAKADARYFIVGPESQFESYEKYLKSTEGAGTELHRLYPRDFWITD
jgi:Zn-dependent M16 (insulinase) family peptidase